MYRKVLIPVDVSVPEDASKLLATAKEISAQWDAELHVVSVLPTVGMAIVGTYFDENFDDKNRAEASERLAKAVSEAGLEAHQHVLFGTVYDQVVVLAGDIGADLIVIGAHQPDLKDYLIGSNASRIVRHSDASVLVVRSA